MTILLPDLRERLRSLDVDHSSWPARLTIRLSATEDAVITSVFPVRILPSVSCGDPDRSGPRSEVLP